jgi:hypothetical protein
MLLDKGIDARAHYRRRDAPPTGGYRGRIEVVRLLLEAGANPMLGNTYGMTSLSVAREPGRAELERILRRLAGSAERPRLPHCRARGLSVVDTLHSVDRGFPPQQLRQLVRQVGSSAEEIAMTSAERLKAEGRVEGRAEGEAKGRAEGKLGGQAELLLKQLSFRFGELSHDVQARVAAASLEQLAVYAERVLSAPSLDDVLR